MGTKRITKTIAEYVTVELLLPKRDKYNNKLAEFQSEIQKEYLKCFVPPKIMRFFKESPGWLVLKYFNSTSYRSNKDIAHNECFTLTAPSLGPNNYLNLEDFKEFDCYEDLVIQRTELRNYKIRLAEKKEEIILTILSFKTMSKLEENFKMAYGKVKSEDRDISSPLPVKNTKILSAWIKED